ncbi:hypothetical protein [Azospirillum soli]|uniref:hypothetical protein n=1 Tax=Azospirillum soli TaxID=1304799 RepID=UPI001AE583B3|nr:hypothetical protein [Azospirillum soli]MBP2314905.1 hypothetical protein [Azospirillum soli]
MLKEATTPDVVSPRRRKAVDLEALTVWAIRDQKADNDGVSLHSAERAAHQSIRQGGRLLAGMEPTSWGTDSCARIAQIAAVGVRVDGGGHARGISARMHPDAEAVMAAVNRLKDRRRRGLVLHYARIGERPDFETGEYRLIGLPADSGAGRGNSCKIVGEWEDTPEQSDIAHAWVAAGRSILDRRGRSLIERAERGFFFRHAEDGRRQVLSRWCPVIAEPSLEEIRAVNETYAEWHAGMMRLLGELLDVTLRDHRVTGFLASVQPWRKEKRLTTS